MPAAADPIRSARPEATAEIAARTGLDEAMLERLVHAFYPRISDDDVLGPIFAARISGWKSHLQLMSVFWSSVALITGRYHDRSLEKRLPLTMRSISRAGWRCSRPLRERSVCPPAQPT